MNSVLTILIIRDNTNDAGGWGYEDEGGYGYGEEDTVEDLNARQGELKGGRNPFWHTYETCMQQTSFLLAAQPTAVG